MDLSYLELEGQGHGIIMEVTRPLFLGQFYSGPSHQTNPPAVYYIEEFRIYCLSRQQLQKFFTNRTNREIPLLLFQET